MKSNNGPTVKYELVKCFTPRVLHRLGEDGFFHNDGIGAGILVKSTGMGADMYHRPELYLKWKHEK